MNAYADSVVSHLFAQSWQIALLAGMVGLISWALKNRSVHLRYLLWLIVLAKCLVPPVLTVPVAVLPERSASPSVAVSALPEEYSEPEVLLHAGGGPKPRESKLAMPSSREWAALGWMAGMCLFLLWVGGRAIRYTAWLHQRRRPPPLGLQESIRALSLGFQFRTWPTIWLLEDISQPFVWGLLRGSIYLPASFVGVSGSDRQRSILAHELGHIARFDAGVNLLQVLAQAVYWFHPFVWWANRRIRQEREKCCDEMAVAHLNTPPEHYTRAIVDTLVTERRSAHPVPSLAIVGSVKDIEERIKTMLRPGKTFRRRPSLVAGAVALLLALVTIPTALVLTARGQAPPAAQRVDKPAAAPPSGEELDLPRYAARTFNSKLALDVRVSDWSTKSFRRAWARYVGRTPSPTPVQIPACWLWVVQPVGPVEDWDVLINEINQNHVPGLVLQQATEAELKRWTGLGGLECLALINAQITDDGLAPLKGLTGLRDLSLAGAKITGAGLEHLQGLTGLSWLDLGDSAITDAGLQGLEGLRGLQRLSLYNTKITNAGLEHLQGLTELQVLYLSSTQVTDAGLAHLRGLTKLCDLSLMTTPITDAGLAHLQYLTGL